MKQVISILLFAFLLILGGGSINGAKDAWKKNNNKQVIIKRLDQKSGGWTAKYSYIAAGLEEFLVISRDNRTSGADFWSR